MAITEILLSKINELKKQLPDNGQLSSLFADIDAEIANIDAAYDKIDADYYYKSAQFEQQIGIIEGLSTDYAAVYIIPHDLKYVIPLKEQIICELIPEPDSGAWGYKERLISYTDKYVHPDDRADVLEKFAFDKMWPYILEKEQFTHHFRLVIDEKIHYYYITATHVKGPNDSLDAVMMCFSCEDAVIEREQLRTLSEMDIMTDIYNRGTGEKMTRTMLDADVVGMFCILDVNNFKNINDTLGHAIGDEVLINFAKELKASFRRDDIVFRLGGDEFAVFAPGITSRKVGIRILTSFVARLKNIHIDGLGDRVIEASIGAMITDSDISGFENVYNTTDSYLYISKNGKNEGNTLTFDPDTEYALI